MPFPIERNVTHRIEEAAFRNGLLILGGASGLINGIAGDHFELLPPYTIEDRDIEFMGRAIRDSLETALSEV